MPDPRQPTQIIYRRIPVRHVLASLKLKADRFGTGSAGAPIDIVWGGSEIWFTGAANALGWIDEERKVRSHARTVGAPPRWLSTGSYLGTRYGYRFIDPDGGRMGRVSVYGVDEDIAFPTGQRPLCLGPWFSRQYELIGTDGGEILHPERNMRLQTPEKNITALGRGPEGLIWYLSGTTLYWIAPDSGISRPVAMPEPIRADELIHGPGSYDTLAYLDRTRNVIGWIRTPSRYWDFEIEEFDLPPGIEPRSLAMDIESLWFSGRGGASLFRLDHMRTAYEYPLADAASDATRLACGAGDLWFTEPGRSSIGRIGTAGL